MYRQLATFDQNFAIRMLVRLAHRGIGTIGDAVTSCITTCKAYRSARAGPVRRASQRYPRAGKQKEGPLTDVAIIHKTTLIPGKLELLASWLPGQPWYLSSGHSPELTKAGGFRLDEAGEARNGGQGYVSATWQLPNSSQARGIFATDLQAPFRV